MASIRINEALSYEITHATLPSHRERDWGFVVSIVPKVNGVTDGQITIGIEPTLREDEAVQLANDIENGIVDLLQDLTGRKE